MSNMRKLLVIESTDNDLHHISISRKDRLPTWEEIKFVREMYGDKNKFYVIVLPPEEFYVNLHPFCMHLWEVKSDKEISTWKQM